MNESRKTSFKPRPTQPQHTSSACVADLWAPLDINGGFMRGSTGFVKVVGEWGTNGVEIVN